MIVHDYPHNDHDSLHSGVPNLDNIHLILPYRLYTVLVVHVKLLENSPLHLLA